MKTGPVTQLLRTLWPRVDPYEVVGVLREQDPASVAALLAELPALSGPDAATRLMVPVADALATRSPADRVEALHALDALVRGGGDPSAILPAAAATLPHRKTRRAAERLLRRAALKGWSLLSLDLPEPTGKDLSARQIYRLAALQRRGLEPAVCTLGIIYDRQPISNMHESLALVEEQLLSGDRASAQAALAGLTAAGADLYRCWLALLPVLTSQLRDGAWQNEAACALGQLRYTPRYAVGLSEAQVAQDVAPRLGEVMAVLAGVLRVRRVVAQSAAQTLWNFAALGVPLDAVRAELEGALSSPDATVRSRCSGALSEWLVRSGQEPPLPRGCSHRRRFAASDTPLEGGGTVRCLACGVEGAQVLYSHEDISQTHADIMAEARCAACGVYSEHRWGY